MKQNHLIGIVMIAFGLYLLLVKLNVIMAFDFILLIAIALIGGYAYRRSSGDSNSGGLLLAGNILTGVYLSRHLSDWLGGVFYLPELSALFYIGLAFLATWLIEASFSALTRRRQKVFLYIGGIMTLIGGYEWILDLLNISPSMIRTFLFPGILILVGVAIIFKTEKGKII